MQTRRDAVASLGEVEPTQIAPAPPRPSPPKDIHAVNFALTGALNRDAKTGNSRNNVQLTWAEPSDAAKPTEMWRFYAFSSSNEEQQTLHLHRESAYLVGRDQRVVDIHVDHETVGEQHAVVQFRMKTYPEPPGSLKPPRRAVRPYIMDLESSHGTSINGARIETARYVELFEKDVLSFGAAKAEYVLLSAGKVV